MRKVVMRMLYYADRISDNIRRREPEGYLICVNVPIARSGTQKYQQDELGQNGGRLVTVYRPEEEVFSKATMSSFEGMPVTNDHPNDEVTVDNAQFYSKGHCQNVRRGTGKDSDLLIADLVINDPQTINDIMNGKREISCGYNYELCEEDGKLVQRQIRGNHIAIVDRGRAGHRVCIKDSAPTNERRKTKMKNHIGILSKMLASLTASDATPEEIEEAVDAIEDITSGEEPAVPTEEKQTDTDPAAEAMAKIMERMDAFEAKLAEIAAKDEDPKEDPAVEEKLDPLQKLEDDLDELEGKRPIEEEDEDEEEEEEGFAPDEDPSEPEAHFVDPEEINEDDADEEIPEEEEEPAVDCGPGKTARDAMRAAIRAVRPVIAKLPPNERRAAADAAVASIRKSYGMSGKPSRNDYIRIKQRRKASDQVSGEAANRIAEKKLQERIMSKRNANYKK